MILFIMILAFLKFAHPSNDSLKEALLSSMCIRNHGPFLHSKRGALKARLLANKQLNSAK